MTMRSMTSRASLTPTRQARRFTDRSIGSMVVRCLRLLALELQRGTGTVCAAAIAIATFWIMWQALPNGVVYWEGVNRSAGMAMAPVAALAGGIAAWEASRDHRRDTTEQMGTTSFPRWAPQSMSVLAITMWAVTGYLVVAMGLYGFAGIRATWSGPEFGYPILVVGALVGAIGFGWLVGTIWRRTIAPLMVVVVIWGGDLIWETTNGLRSIFGYGSSGFEVSPEQINSANPPQPPSGLETFFQNDGAWRYLVPSEYVSEQVITTNVTGWAVLWMAGLGVVFFLIARWWQRRSVAVGMLILVALVVASMGGAGAAAKYDFHWGIRAEQDPPQVCTTRLDGALTVCLHEKQEALLPETADIVAHLLTPIADRTWVPMRWESGSSEARGNLAEGIALINFYDRDEIESLELHERILMNLLAYPGGDYYGITGGDYVVLTWLLHEAGISREEAVSRGVLPDVPVEEVRQMSRYENLPDPVALDAAAVDAAIERFLALPDAEREAWLDANWIEVFMGTLTLEDLP